MPGRVDFCLQIQHEHTVCFFLRRDELVLRNLFVCTYLGRTESLGHGSWRNYSQYGYISPQCSADYMLAETARVDLGGSLAVASKGLHATGVSTDMNGPFYLSRVRAFTEGFQ